MLKYEYEGETRERDSARCFIAERTAGDSPGAANLATAWLELGTDSAQPDWFDFASKLSRYLKVPNQADAFALILSTEFDVVYNYMASRGIEDDAVEDLRVELDSQAERLSNVQLVPAFKAANAESERNDITGGETEGEDGTMEMQSEELFREDAKDRTRSIAASEPEEVVLPDVELKQVGILDLTHPNWALGCNPERHTRKPERRAAGARSTSRRDIRRKSVTATARKNSCTGPSDGVWRKQDFMRTPWSGSARTTQPHPSTSWASRRTPSGSILKSRRVPLFFFFSFFFFLFFFFSTLALDAWTVGLRALSNAYREARESRLQDIGKSVLEDMDTQLKSTLALQEKQLRDALGQFFDPSSGEVTRRLKDFVDDRGELARFLEKHIGVEDSTLAKTLARQVGENSELFKKLSPTDKEGLIHVLEERLGEVMSSSEQQVARALDPMAEDSPVSRFLKSLQDKLKASQQSQAEQLTEALKAIDANDETSLINRLAKETRDAKTSLLQAINPQDPRSPLGSMKSALESMLEKQGVSAKEFREKQEQRQHELEVLIKEALARFETKKQHDANSAHGGATFEESVVQFVADAASGQQLRGRSHGRCGGDDSSQQGGRRGGPLHRGERVRWVQSGDRGQARPELHRRQVARGARDGAQESRGVSGAFRDVGYACSRRLSGVRSIREQHPRHLGPGRRPSDHRFRAALTAALCLATRKEKVADEGDIRALERVRIDIEKQLDRMSKIRKSNDSIKSHADKIENEVRLSEKGLKKLVENAEKTLRALNVELVNEDEEVRTPIRLSSMPPGW